MKGTALAHFGLGPDLSVMRENDLLGDRQAQTRAAFGFAPKAVHLLKRMKELSNILSRNASARILHTQMHDIRFLFCGDRNAPFFGIFNGITYQIRKNLDDPVPIEL